MIGSPDTYWFVLANSPIKSLADAAGKTISYSQNGSSSHTALLALLDQYKVAAQPVSTGGHPATLTMTMTGQIDIGRGAAPFGLELVDEGKIRIVARGSEIKARADQTVRVCLANAQVLASAGDAVARFMQGYRDTLDWMYADPAAMTLYEEFSNVRRDADGQGARRIFPQSDVMAGRDPRPRSGAGGCAQEQVHRPAADRGRGQGHGSDTGGYKVRYLTSHFEPRGVRRRVIASAGFLHINRGRKVTARQDHEPP